MVIGFTLLDLELGLPQPLTPLWTISDIRFGHRQSWPLELLLERGGDTVRLIFREVVSFRAHDESEILTYWTARPVGSPIGSIYRIAESDYLAEFADSTAALMGQPMTHYLVAGNDLCVEVLASQPPALS